MTIKTLKKIYRTLQRLFYARKTLDFMKSTCYTGIMEGGTKQQKDKDLGREKDKQRGREFNSLEVANIRLYHEVIIKRADENP